jgi:hypothetical protein
MKPGVFPNIPFPSPEFSKNPFESISIPVRRQEFSGYSSSPAGIFFFLTLFALGGSPTPHPISSRPHFCMGPVHLSPVTWPQALRCWYSLTPLIHIVAQLRPIDLHNLLGQIPESSQFLGASKLPLLERTSLNAGSLTHTYSVSIYPLMKACVSYLSAMILHFLDPQIKWAMLSPQGCR